MNSKCPLCHGSRTNLFYSQQKVNWDLYSKQKTQLEFFKCDNCCLVFKDRSVLLDLKSQRPRYLEHQNEPSEGYEKFLMKLWGPFSKLIARGQHGLDFGCGPTQALSSLITKNQVTCDFYDPLFYPQTDLLKKNYDFVYCSEVVEHFLELNREWSLLTSLLKPSAPLGVMTSFYPSDFSEWYYHRDPTHVSFYVPETFEWIANNFGFELLNCKENVVLLKLTRN